jgi:riboflavin kinase/FMN adenylyltransferase
VWIATTENEVLIPTAIALGNFDGIHRGHQSILEPILASASYETDIRVYPTVVSFYPHPREFFTGEKIKLLTPVAEKAKHLANLGIEQLVLLPFNQKLASLSPQEFVEEIVVKELQAKEISVGKDFRFGYQRQGTVADLQAIAANYDIKVHINSLRQCWTEQEENVRISSSLIRQALEKGEIERANNMLGRPYTLMGKIIRGKQLGRTIGFPTANLELPADKFLPRYGVYSVNVTLEDSDSSLLKGVMNIGCRPTVEGSTSSVSVEVHLLDWSGNLYDRTLTVNLEKFLRPEQKFSSLDALKQQIAVDCQAARYIISQKSKVKSQKYDFKP